MRCFTCVMDADGNTTDYTQFSPLDDECFICKGAGKALYTKPSVSDETEHIVGAHIDGDNADSTSQVSGVKTTGCGDPTNDEPNTTRYFIGLKCTLGNNVSGAPILREYGSGCPCLDGNGERKWFPDVLLHTAYWSATHIIAQGAL